MKLHSFRTVIFVLTASLSLLIASPSLQKLLVFPVGDKISEMWLLGPSHKVEYPSNTTTDENLRLYVVVNNHLGSSAYYSVEVKFRNQTQSEPNSFNHTHSTLPSICAFNFFVADNQTYELPMDISLGYELDRKIPLRLNMQNVTVNGVTIGYNSTVIDWDIAKAGFYGNLFFELWRLNETTGTFQYHQRYVGLWLKLAT